MIEYGGMDELAGGHLSLTVCQGSDGQIGCLEWLAGLMVGQAACYSDAWMPGKGRPTRESISYIG